MQKLHVSQKVFFESPVLNPRFPTESPGRERDSSNLAPSLQLAECVMESVHSPHQQHCEDCAHFRQDELDTGYCQLHSMFVLRAFWCQKFLQRPAEAQKGGEDRGSENANIDTAFSETNR
jgi:hypothetical protein